MNKRIFFFGDINFPRGNAAANYVQYMAHALIREEWKVIVVGTNKVKKDLSQPIRGIAEESNTSLFLLQENLDSLKRRIWITSLHYLLLTKKTMLLFTEQIYFYRIM